MQPVAFLFVDNNDFSVILSEENKHRVAKIFIV